MTASIAVLAILALADKQAEITIHAASIHQNRQPQVCQVRYFKTFAETYKHCERPTYNARNVGLGYRHGPFMAGVFHGKQRNVEAYAGLAYEVKTGPVLLGAMAGVKTGGNPIGGLTLGYRDGPVTFRLVVGPKTSHLMIGAALERTR